MTPRIFFLAIFSLALAAALSCSRGAPSAEAPSASADSAPVPFRENEAPSSRPDDGRGGRLFDRFYDKQTFLPDDKKTLGVPDGRGGPFRDGTLPLADGTQLLNDSGHDYRLKNFFGWDLRGAAGIYGPSYQNKVYVVDVNLLEPGRSPEQITELLTRGTANLPAYGGVLSAEEIDAVVHVALGMQKGQLPHPDRIWTLSEGTPGNYRLNAGADAERGKKLFAERCSDCHGTDGTNILFDGGEFSLGSHARQKAFEDWFKILSGQPGTKMKRFVDGDGREMGQQILDILAGLCDVRAFPKGAASGDDVSAGDPRCGEYLKE